MWDKGVKGRRDRKVSTDIRKKLRGNYTRGVYVLILERIKIYFVKIIVAIMIETSIRYIHAKIFYCIFSAVTNLSLI